MDLLSLSSVSRAAIRGKNVRPVILLAAILLCAGCATVPPSCPAALPEVFMQRFAQSLPANFEAMHSVVIGIKPHWWWPAIRQVALGCSRVDRATRSYHVICLSPLGMKLFDVACTNGQVRGAFLFTRQGNQEGMVRALGDAVSRVYLDMTPGPHATVIRRGDKLIFQQASGDGRVVYTFSSTNALLRSKDYYEGRRRTMTITYDNYRPAGDRSFPGSMSLRDYRYGYRLDFVLKEYMDLTNGALP